MGWIRIERRLPYAVPLVERRLPVFARANGFGPFLRQSEVRVDVQPNGANDSRVVVDFRYVVGGGLLGTAADAVFVNALLTLAWRWRLRSLESALCDATAACP